MKVNTKVFIPNIGFGKIGKIRIDIYDKPMYTVILNDNSLTPDGLYYARENDMREVCPFRFNGRLCGLPKGHLGGCIPYQYLRESDKLRTK